MEIQTDLNTYRERLNKIAQKKNLFKIFIEFKQEIKHI